MQSDRAALLRMGGQPRFRSTVYCAPPTGLQVFRAIVVTALLVMSPGCGPSKFDQLVNSTKKHCRAADIWRAALPLFGDRTVTNNVLPSEIASLPIFAEAPQNIDWYHSTSNALVFSTGGGFGHWGIVVCRSAIEPQDTNSFHASFVPWQDGVLFWEELQ